MLFVTFLYRLGAMEKCFLLYEAETENFNHPAVAFAI
jgi:hypothetical protein